MKELSIEEKAKAYDEAIEYAHYLINERCKEGTDGSFHRLDLERMFPELKESEDERIRKWIIGVLSTYEHDRDLRNAAIAWLEKQGEIIREWSELKINNIQTELQEMVDLKQKTEQGEQKPTWSEEDERMCTKTIFALAGFMGNEDKIDWLKSLKDKVQPKKEWSEEDDNCLSTIIAEFSKCSGKSVSKDKWMRCNDFLNSLKDRVQPQPKQEWNQNDIDMIDWLIRCCEKEHEELCNDKYGHQDIVSDLKRDCRKKWNWLESLKNKVVPQNRWKPSKELLDVFIKNATDFFESNFNPLTDGGVIGAFDDKEKMIEEFKEYMKEEGFNEEWI